MPNTARKPGSNSIVSSIKQLQKTPSWQVLADVLTIPKTKKDYNRMKGYLRELILTTEDSPDSLYNGLIEVLSLVLEAYEDQHYPVPAATPGQTLRFLMDEHGLKQDDLPEVGSQGVVSEILVGKRELNRRQIKVLSQRFGISAAAFI